MHTRALTGRASCIVSRSQRHGDGAEKERAPLLGSYNSRKDRLAIYSGGAAPVPKILGGLQPPQPPRFLRHSLFADLLVLIVTSSVLDQRLRANPVRLQHKLCLIALYNNIHARNSWILDPGSAPAIGSGGVPAQQATRGKNTILESLSRVPPTIPRFFTAKMTGCLTLQSLQVAGSQLSMRYSFDKYHFSLSYWYDFDLESLDGMYGSQFMQKVYAHCAAFSFYLCGLNPDVLDLGPCSHWHTAEFERVWKTAWNGLSGQWRFQNDLPHAKPPRSASEPSPPTAPVSVQQNSDSPTTLAFFGGGKDSVVMCELLSRAGIPFSTMMYSHTSCGTSSFQHNLTDKILESLRPACKGYVRHHKLWTLQDFCDSPVQDSLGKQLGIKALYFLAEVPCSLFAALPIVLYYGYSAIAMGNERSANVGNLVWEATGEEVNHQWQKAKESVILFRDYIHQALISNVQYFSTLQSIHDLVIFSVAESRLDAIVHTHSCNFIKPWCKCCLFGRLTPGRVGQDHVRRYFADSAW